MAIKLPRPLRALADASKISIWVLYKIEEGKREATAKQAIAIEGATNGAVPRSVLRPDLWPSDHGSSLPAAS